MYIHDTQSHWLCILYRFVVRTVTVAADVLSILVIWHFDITQTHAGVLFDLSMKWLHTIAVCSVCVDMT